MADRAAVASARPYRKISPSPQGASARGQESALRAERAKRRKQPGKRLSLRYLGLQVLVAWSHISVALQSAGPVGAGVDGDVCARTGSAKTVTKPVKRATETNLRMASPPWTFR